MLTVWANSSNSRSLSLHFYPLLSYIIPCNPSFTDKKNLTRNSHKKPCDTFISLPTSFPLYTEEEDPTENTVASAGERPPSVA